MEKKIKLLQTVTSFKDTSGEIKRKVSYSVEINGMLQRVYLKPSVNSAGFIINLPKETFEAMFQFEVPNYSRASSATENDQ
jgi:hypothetical protein